MNSRNEILQQIIKYEPVLLAFFCLLIIGRVMPIPHLEIPLFIFTYGLFALYIFKIVTSEKQLNRMENFIRSIYLLLIIFGIFTLVMHVQDWYDVQWAMKLFLTGIPMLVIISTVRKIEFRGVFGETDVFLTTFICIAFLLFLFYRD